MFLLSGKTLMAEYGFKKFSFKRKPSFLKEILNE
jgi:hypothetical protein